MNAVDGVAHVLRGGDDDGEGQHAGGGQPGGGGGYNHYHHSLTQSLNIPKSAYYKGRDTN